MKKVLTWIWEKCFNFTFIGSIWIIGLIITNQKQDKEIDYLMDQVLYLSETDNDLYKNQNELLDRLIDGLESLKKREE